MTALQNLAFPLVLASASPARAALLRAAGLRLEQRVVPIDEALVREGLKADGVDGTEAALALASLKGERVATGAAAGELVLAADQLLETAAGAWLDKPLSRPALRAQLELLAGATHTLRTAAVLFRSGQRVWHHVASPRVAMRPLRSQAIERYLEAVGDDVLGCVGGYQVEALGAHLIAAIHGDRFAVQGLPLLEVLAALRTQGALFDD